MKTLKIEDAEQSELLSILSELGMDHNTSVASEGPILLVVAPDYDLPVLKDELTFRGINYSE